MSLTRKDGWLFMYIAVTRMNNTFRFIMFQMCSYNHFLTANATMSNDGELSDSLCCPTGCETKRATSNVPVPERC